MKAGVHITCKSKYLPGLSEPLGVREGHGPPNFGRSINPISTRKGGRLWWIKIMPTTLLIAPPPPLDFQTFLRPWPSKDHMRRKKWMGWEKSFYKIGTSQLTNCPFWPAWANEWLYQRCAGAHFISLCAKLMPLTIRKRPSKVPTISSCKF